jgi:uncharacterized protein DUF6647
LSVLGAVSLFLVVASICYSRGDRQVAKPSDRQWSIRFFAKSALVTSATVLSLVFMARLLADPPGQKLTIADEYGMSVGITDEEARIYSVQRSIQVIATWLSAEFGMPEFDQYPRIEFVPPEQMAMLRYAGSPQAWAQNKMSSGGLATLSRETVAIYVDAERAVYLSTAWTGNSPADLSVLVHEMVHHLQNLAGEKFECSQAREKPAYAAQERWLARFGGSLEADFELDGFSLLAKTRCLY